jgi:hypothetical protein
MDAQCASPTELPISIVKRDPKRLAPYRFPATIETRGFRAARLKKGARSLKAGKPPSKIWEEST